MRPALRFFLLIALLLPLWPGAAPCQETPVSQAGPGGPVGQDEQAEQADRVLQARMQRAFSSIEEFRNVKVAVQGGVARISGMVANPEESRQAEELARRFDDALYVVNELDTAAGVSRRLAPVWRKLSDMAERALELTPLIGVALAALLLFGIVARLILALDRPFARLSHNQLMANLARKLVATAFFGLGLLIALEVLGLTTLVGGLLGAAGLFGLAVGFAFRDIVENYLAGIILSVRSPFTVKDWVDVGGHQGSVVRLTNRELVLMTLDGNHVRIPNSQVFKSVIYNYTRNPLRRFTITVGIGVEVEIEKARAAGLAALRGMEGVLDDPPPFMRVRELGDFSVALGFFGWVDQANYDFLKVESEAVRQLKAALDRAGVDMPYPVTTVRLEQAGGEGPEALRGGKPRPLESAESKTTAADVKRESYLDEQIEEDASRAKEKNLLEGGG